jgi:positive regulator of sigma E activity
MERLALFAFVIGMIVSVVWAADTGNSDYYTILAGLAFSVAAHLTLKALAKHIKVLTRYVRIAISMLRQLLREFEERKPDSEGDHLDKTSDNYLS